MTQISQWEQPSHHGTDNIRYGGQPSARNITNQVTKKISWLRQSSNWDSRRRTSPQNAENRRGQQIHPESPYTTLETRRAKCKRSFQVLKEHAKNSTCPYGLQYRPKPHIRFDREFQIALDQIGHRSHAELLALMNKQQEKNLAADNQAIKAQQQPLRNLCLKQQSSQGSRNQPANEGRLRPRPRTHKTPQNVQQTCNFTSMQAKLSELQKMFCQLSESVNVNKNIVRNSCPSLPCQVNLATTRTELGCSRKWLGRNQTRTCFSIFPPSNG